MGMYDFINDNQVKCFYVPMYTIDAYIDKPCIYYSHGTMDSFNIGDELPLSTLYYKYPDNFMIFDYDFNMLGGCVHVIKDKKIFKTVENILELNSKDFENNELVVDYYGSPLSIETREDMECFLSERARFLENPEGYKYSLSAVKNRYKKEHVYRKEMYLGELIFSLLTFRMRVDMQLRHFNNKAHLEACTNSLREYIQGNPGIIDRYMSWVDVDDDFKQQIKNVLAEILD